MIVVSEVFCVPLTAFIYSLDMPFEINSYGNIIFYFYQKNCKNIIIELKRMKDDSVRPGRPCSTREKLLQIIMLMELVREVEEVGNGLKGVLMMEVLGRVV